MAFYPVILLFVVCPYLVHAQRMAILTPDKAVHSRNLAEKLAAELQGKLRVLDTDLGQAAYASLWLETPFNLTIEESKRIGAVIGCDAFVLMRSANQRRSAFGRSEYYEAFAVVYLVSSRTGRLIWWQLISREATFPTAADKLLEATIGKLSDEIAGSIRLSIAREVNEPAPASIEDVPAENSQLSKGFRAPVPYKRIKPDYTPMAALYEVTATIEALVDLDASGVVQRVEIVRWAGYGLDESVEKAIRAMNWRPAERSGKPLAMRFLVRYNFKKIEKDPPAQ